MVDIPLNTWVRLWLLARFVNQEDNHYYGYYALIITQIWVWCATSPWNTAEMAESRWMLCFMAPCVSAMTAHVFQIHSEPHLIVSAAAVQCADANRFAGRGSVLCRVRCQMKNKMKWVLQMCYGIYTGANMTAGKHNKHKGATLSEHKKLFFIIWTYQHK